MAVRTIRIMGDPILEKKSRTVEAMTPKIQDLIADMFDTMHEQSGVGLAAPQVGMLKRIFVVDLTEYVEDGIEQVFINPEVIETSGEQIGAEGCLSLPGKNGTVKRPDYVKIKALDENMEEFTIEGSELMARAILHENDHLDGILYTQFVEGGLKDNADNEEEEEE